MSLEEVAAARELNSLEARRDVDIARTIIATPTARESAREDRQDRGPRRFSKLQKALARSPAKRA